MENKYQYRPLPNEESIRVLILDPGKGDEPLSGVLKVIHLSNRRQTLRSAQRDHKRRKTSSESGVIRWTPEIPYEAISYVWGPNVKDHIILLNGKTHQITANLSDALYQCRQTDKSRVLWADSVCIDQGELEEKNHQVYMMGRIYASSQRTLICLGTDPDNRDHARDALGLISDVNQMIQEEFQRPGFSWEPDSFPQPFPEDPLVHDSRWQSVDFLLCLPWFLRGWVVQEAALGREACVIWADRKIELMAVLRAYTWYARRARFLTDESQGVGRSTSRLFPQIFFQERKAETRVFFQSHMQMYDLDIMSALDHSRKLGLSNPRDRIYAFMALPFVKNPMPALRPNYEQPHFEVYRDFAVKYLDNTSNLNILCYVANYDVNGDSIHGTLGSSWVPRWDCTTWGFGLNRTDTNFGLASAEPAEFTIMSGEYDASATLQVRAVIFDSIKLISRRIEHSMTIEDLTSLWSLWSKQAGSGITSSQVEPSPDNHSLEFLSALTSELVAGVNYKEWAEMLKSYSRFLQDSKKEDPLSPGSAQMSPDIQFCHQRLVEFAHGLHIFLLERGYFGLGSWAIKQDDVCAFVFGVQKPIILRKVPDAGIHHYKVVGPAFVVSNHPNDLGIPVGLHRQNTWNDWDGLCKFEGWADWGLKEEKIILL